MYTEARTLPTFRPGIQAAERSAVGYFGDSAVRAAGYGMGVAAGRAIAGAKKSGSVYKKKKRKMPQLPQTPQSIRPRARSGSDASMRSARSWKPKVKARSGGGVVKKVGKRTSNPSKKKKKKGLSHTTEEYFNLGGSVLKVEDRLANSAAEVSYVGIGLPMDRFLQSICHAIVAKLFDMASKRIIRWDEPISRLDKYEIEVKYLYRYDREADVFNTVPTTPAITTYNGMALQLYTEIRSTFTDNIPANTNVELKGAFHSFLLRSFAGTVSPNTVTLARLLAENVDVEYMHKVSLSAQNRTPSGLDAVTSNPITDTSDINANPVRGKCFHWNGLILKKKGLVPNPTIGPSFAAFFLPNNVTGHIAERGVDHRYPGYRMLPQASYFKNCIRTDSTTVAPGGISTFTDTRYQKMRLNDLFVKMGDYLGSNIKEAEPNCGLGVGILFAAEKVVDAGDEAGVNVVLGVQTKYVIGAKLSFHKKRPSLPIVEVS